MASLPPVLAALPARRWFAIDGAGALVSAVALALAAPHEAWTGVPTTVVYALVVPALALAAFSGSRALFGGEGARPLLRRLAVANLTYCVASLGVVATFAATVTPLAAAWIVGEAGIIVLLASAEWRAAAVAQGAA